MGRISRIPAAVDVEAAQNPMTPVVDIAEDSGLTVYDAAYLELAKRKGLPLASRDGGLNKACRRAGVPVLL